MKNYIIFLLLFSFTIINVNAQIDPFEDDMESYVVGQPIFEGHWTDWGCGGGAGCAIMSTADQAQGGTQSGLIPDDGTTDAVLDLGNKIFDEWGIEFFMYIPSGKEGYWNLQGEVPIGAGEWIVGNIYFNQDNVNPGVGLIDDAVGSPVNFTFPHDEWFRIVMQWNIESGISLATWGMTVANEWVIEVETPFTTADGTPPTSLGGINFFSISINNQYFLDTINFINYWDGDIFILSNNDFSSKEFKAYPNPVEDILRLSANEEISSLSITNILGQVIYSQKINALSSTIDMSSFAKGTYFVKAIIGNTVGTVKIIK